ncbi:MAG: MFS transporter [Acidobacteriota bacterium]|nr:MAG: MFS transporter [Acidobacteriota bacterium]
MNSVGHAELLRGNRNFRQLWFGQLISELGTWFSFIAELGLVQKYSGSSWMTTWLLVARLLPVLLMAPIAGVVVDRWDRRRVLIVMDVIRALIALGYLSLGFGAPVWVAIICSGMMSASNTFFDAGKNASIANMVTRQEMLTANVLMFSTRFLQLTLGAALGGVTAAKFGYNAAFVINSLSFLLSAWFIIRIPAAAMRRRAGEDGAPEVRRNAFLLDVREGLSFIRANRFVRAVIMVNVGWAMGGGMNNLIFDRMSRIEFRSFGGSNGDWAMALLTTAAGAGLFAGMMMARRAGSFAVNERRAGNYIGWSLLVHGICFATAGIMPTIWLFALFVAVSRMILGAEFGVQETLMMRVLPDEYRGRVFTTDRALELSMMMLATLLAGFLMTRISPRSVMVISGLLSALPGAVWLLAMWLRRLSVPETAFGEMLVESRK